MTPRQQRLALADEKDGDPELLHFAAWADYQRYRHESSHD